VNRAVELASEPPLEPPTSEGPLRAVARHPLWVAVALVVAALLVRVQGIESRSLWLDEAWTLDVALHGPAEIVEIARKDQHPPGYYLLAAGWSRVFGLSETGVRSLSLVASALSVAALFLLGLRFFGVEAAVAAVLLCLASGEHAYYATEARAYAISGLLCLASFAVFLRGVERGDGRGFLWLAPLNALAVYVHFTAAFAFVAQLAGAALLLRSSPRATLRWVASQVLAVALFAPEIELLFLQMPKAGEYWLRTPGFDQLLRVLTDFAGGGLALSLYAMLLAAALAAAVLQRPWGVRARLVAVMALWAFVPILASFLVAQATPVFLTRYLLYASLGWFLLAGVAAAALPVPAFARLAAVVVLAGASLVEFRAGGYPAPDWRAIAAAVGRYRTPAALVLVTPGYECLPFGYYLEPGRFRSGSLVVELAAANVHCVDDDQDLPRPPTPPARLIQVLGPRGKLHPERVLLRYGQSSYRPIAVDRFEKAILVVHDRTAPPDRR
jgi:mannosyltransferase